MALPRAPSAAARAAVRECLAEGKVVAARIADHIEPHRNDAVKFWNGALQSLCAHCHESRKKFIEHRGFDKAIGADGMPIDPRHPVRIPGAAAQTRVVSMAGIRLGPWESARAFKGIICDDISEFESHMPSHAVGSL
jgi:5-methylcytosine-specific restriction enzyme A